MTTPTPTVEWDTTGTYIVGTTFTMTNPQTGTAPTSEAELIGGVSALQATMFQGLPDVQRAVITSHTAIFDFGSGPTEYVYTYIQCWVGVIWLAGDQVLAIIDLLANPPV